MATSYWLNLQAEVLALGLFTGFAVVFSLTAFVNKAGDYLYHKGIAKPFYVRGYRLHHKNFLLVLIPGAYVVLATLIYLHFFEVLWGNLWPGIEVTVLLAAFCLTIDFSLDALIKAEKRMTLLLHHEWVYLVLPAYIFTHLVALV